MAGPCLTVLCKTEAPLAVLDKILQRNRLPKLAGLPPFKGGLQAISAMTLAAALSPHTRLPRFPALCPDSCCMSMMWALP
jgi:hypothetical protein